MTSRLLAEFADEVSFVEAARRVQSGRYRLLDACTPFPVESVHELLEQRRSHIRLAMLIGGVAMAALAYGTESYSAAIAYPYNSGGRPFHSWPAFMLVPFATGILVAAIAGFAAFLIETGLPRLYDPLFAVTGFERASQDRFVLVLARPETEDDWLAAIELLRSAGAVAFHEVGP
jgi:hypothetical protein